jgi:hypothetical protein
MSQGVFIFEVLEYTQWYASHSVGLLWRSDQPDTQNSTWQHTTFTTDIQAPPGGIQTRGPNKRPATDTHLKRRHHQDPQGKI